MLSKPPANRFGGCGRLRKMKGPAEAGPFKGGIECQRPHQKHRVGQAGQEQVVYALSITESSAEEARKKMGHQRLHLEVGKEFMSLRPVAASDRVAMISAIDDTAAVGVENLAAHV
jgi:hypothetical protein